jgi:four helix bundle protein
MTMKTINDLEIYREAMDLSEEVYLVASKWEYFDRDTLGKQIIRSADSIAANLAEGYGRFHFKENLRFCYYSRGSLEETQTWIEKATRRNLIDSEKGRELYAKLETLKKRLNAYIKSIGSASEPH